MFFVRVRMRVGLGMIIVGVVRKNSQSISLIGDDDVETPGKLCFVLEIDVNVFGLLLGSFVEERQASLLTIDGQLHHIVFDRCRCPLNSFSHSIVPDIAVRRPAVSGTQFVISNIAKGRFVRRRTDANEDPRRPIVLIPTRFQRSERRRSRWRWRWRETSSDLIFSNCIRT